MGFLTLKTLAATVALGTAISTSAMPAAMVPQLGPAQTYEVVSDTTLKAGNSVNLPAKAIPINELTTLAIPKFIGPDNATIGDKLDAWLNDLAQIESNGRDNLKVLDVNGFYSYGCLQFQMATFILYGRKYGMVNGSENNLGTLIMNCNVQKQIAKRMILENSANWKNWYTSVAIKNLGLPPVD